MMLRMHGGTGRGQGGHRVHGGYREENKDTGRGQRGGQGVDRVLQKSKPFP